MIASICKLRLALTKGVIPIRGIDMRMIDLGGGFATLVDAVLYEQVVGFRWRATRDSTTGMHYASRWDKSRNGYEQLHRVVLSRVLGRPLQASEQVDHANGDRLDNRAENLRLATPTQQSQNRKKRAGGLSVYKGVRLYPRMRTRPWGACITINKRQHHLGYFRTEREAGYAYNEAAAEHFGTFARFNPVFAP